MKALATFRVVGMSARRTSLALLLVCVAFLLSVHGTGGCDLGNRERPCERRNGTELAVPPVERRHRHGLERQSGLG